MFFAAPHLADQPPSMKLAGVHVLEQGGNAVDAAVATALCQGIYNPMASGIGGGTFLLIRLANGTSAVIDAREVAPAAANETMFSGASSRPQAGSHQSAQSCQVAPRADEMRPFVDRQRAMHFCVQVMQHSL